jgi:MFS family permease
VGWPLLLCCAFGLSTPSVAVYSLGQFLGPLEAEFGWTRTQASTGLAISLVIGFVTSPLVGRLIDRTSAKVLVLPALALLALAIAGFSFATSSLAVWIALWVLHGLAGAIIGPTIWLAVVSGLFDRFRSLAFAIALCGTNLSAAFAPAVARALIDGFGWRQAYQMLGLSWVGVALALSIVLLKDHRRLGKGAATTTKPSSPVILPSAPPMPPVALKAVFLSPTFVRVALAVIVTTTLASAFAIHLAPVLVAKGLTLVEAANVAGIMGLAAIPGKLATGSLFDRLGVGWSAAAIMTLLGLSCVLFALPSQNVPMAMTACALFGLATGANITLVTVVTSRSFDPSVFGVVYSTIMSLTALGAAVGPVLLSATFDAFGSYSPAFWAGIPVSVIAALLLQKIPSTPPGSVV